MVAFVFSFISLIIGVIVGIVLIGYRDEYSVAKAGAVTSFSIAVILFAVLMVVACTTSVSTGHTGVVTKFGEVQEYTLDSGLHGKSPWEKVIEMDNRVQKVTVDMECFSSDIQEVKCKYTLNYQISKENAQVIYKSIGTDYYTNVVEPNIAKSVKTITARYTAETLVGSRDQLASEIEVLLRETLVPYHIDVVGTSVEDLNFAENFTNAVEAKQVAVQNKLKAVTEQEQKTIEEQQAAERAKIKATADAEVAKIQAQADMEVAKIGADSAEYQGKKEAAVALQRLASVNGWSVLTNAGTGINEFFKADGEKVSAEELKQGSEKLMQYYYTTQWNGVLPETYIGSDAVSGLINIG